MKRLLLVDDDPDFRRLLARALERRGFAVATAASAQEAARCLEAATPDGAVVDMKLDQASGLELIAPLRQASATMRIVVLTGFASIATTVEAIKRGADNYLAKPVDMEALLAAITGTPAARARLQAPVANAMSVRRLEWEHIQRVLHQHGGNVSAAARALGMHRRTLQRKLAKHPVRR